MLAGIKTKLGLVCRKTSGAWSPTCCSPRPPLTLGFLFSMSCLFHPSPPAHGQAWVRRRPGWDQIKHRTLTSFPPCPSLQKGWNLPRLWEEPICLQPQGVKLLPMKLNPPRLCIQQLGPRNSRLHGSALALQALEGPGTSGRPPARGPWGPSPLSCLFLSPVQLIYAS